MWNMKQTKDLIVWTSIKKLYISGKYARKKNTIKKQEIKSIRNKNKNNDGKKLKEK